MAILICLVALAGIVAGCGSSDDSSSAGTTAASGDETSSSGADSGSTAAEAGEAESDDGNGGDSAGGDDGGGGDGTGTLTRDEFVKQANAACAESKAAINTYFSKEIGDKIPGPAKVKAFAEDVVVPSLREEGEALRAIGLPSGEEEEVEAILDAFDEALVKAEKDPSGVVAGTIDPFDKSGKMADAYGLEGCAQL